MRPATRLVYQTPSLSLTLTRLGEDSVGDIFKSNTVDSPFSVRPFENEFVINSSSGSSVCQVCEMGCDWTVVVSVCYDGANSPFDTSFELEVILCDA